MIQPRFGFNWNPQPGTVIRGGYGMFYGQISNSSYYTVRRENGVYQKQYGPSRASTANVLGVSTAPASPAACHGRPAPRSSGYRLLQQQRRNTTAYCPRAACRSSRHRDRRRPIRSPARRSRLPVITSVAGGTITIRGLDPSFTNPVSHSWDLPSSSSCRCTPPDHRLRRQPRDCACRSTSTPTSIRLAVTNRTSTSYTNPPPASLRTSSSPSTPIASTPPPARWRPASRSSTPGITPWWSRSASR